MSASGRVDCDHFHCATCICSTIFDHLPIIPSNLTRNLLDELKELQMRITAFKISVANALRHHNDMLPISRLPPEILGEIFLCIHDISSNDSEWLAVSQTHYSWRSIALSQHCLWSTLDLSSNGSVFAEMVRRSHGTPLRLELFDEEEYYYPRDLQGRLALWDTVDLANIRGFSFEASRKVLDIIWPRILAAAAHVQSIDAISPRDPVNLTPEILDGDYPHLTILRLENHIFKWGCNLLSAPNLRVLSIINHDGGILDLPAPSFFAALRLLSMLEELTLHHCLPWDDSPPAASEVFTLPRLTWLDLKDSYGGLVDLCNCLNLPATCRTRIWCTEGCCLEEGDPLIKLTLASGARIHGGYIEEENEGKVFASMDFTSESAFRYLRLPNRGDNESDDFRRGLSDALAKVETDALSLIPVGLEDETGISQLWDNFGGSTTAKLVHLDWTMNGGRLGWGSELDLAGCFLKMDTLILEGLCVDEEDTGSEESNVYNDVTTPDDLMEELSRRSKRDGLFRKLQLVDCDMPEALFDNMRRVLPEVERVDGEHNGQVGCWARRMAES